MNTFKITLLNWDIGSGNSPRRHKEKRGEKSEEKKRTSMLENRNSVSKSIELENLKKK